MWRGLILAKALEQFLVDVQLGRPRLPAHRHAARHRRHPDGARRGCCRRPRCSWSPRPRKGAQKVAARVADMARRSYLKVLGVVENMHEFVAPDGSRHAIFGSGGGQRLAALTGAPLVGEVPIEGAVSEGGDIGKPVVLAHPDAARGASRSPTIARPDRRRSSCRRSRWPAAPRASSSSSRSSRRTSQLTTSDTSQRGRAVMPAQHELRDAVREHDERREQAGHDGLRDVDVQLLVQVRRRQAEDPADDHEARGARERGGDERRPDVGRNVDERRARRRGARVRAGSRGCARARRPTAAASTMSSTYGDTVGHGVTHARNPLTSGPSVSPAAAATDAASAPPATCCLGCSSRIATATHAIDHARRRSRR